jgi:hypothetical protein
VYEYSHLGGKEILLIKYPSIRKEILAVIDKIVPKKTKQSKEKTMMGEMLFSPKQMNKDFKKAFRAKGFEELKLHYVIAINEPEYKIEIKTAYKQIDFAKSNVLVEVQFGKYAFMFYDMAKFQYFYNEAKADVGVEIVPCHALYSYMSTGVSYGEQLVNDIERLRRHFPSVPVDVILIDAYS